MPCRVTQGRPGTFLHPALHLHKGYQTGHMNSWCCVLGLLGTDKLAAGEMPGQVPSDPGPSRRSPRQEGEVAEAYLGYEVPLPPCPRFYTAAHTKVGCQCTGVSQTATTTYPPPAVSQAHAGPQEPSVTMFSDPEAGLIPIFREEEAVAINLASQGAIGLTCLHNWQQKRISVLSTHNASTQ